MKKINLFEAYQAPYSLRDDVSFKGYNFNKKRALKDIPFCHVDLEVSFEEGLFRLDIYIDAKLTLECMYSLELFSKDIELDETIYFSLNNENIDDEEKDIFYIKDSNIDLRQYIVGLINLSLPLSIKKPGATLPKSGDNYQVLSSEEFEEYKAKMNRPFASELDALYDELED
ncbi:MAG: DUF177 domain-containing protein [Erysipelotrichaceae bacterium]|jgi:uncharacterized metal-binding protein YceD (DUF177 family)|nr:YceD family protein [Bacillota bacterium]MDY0118846.1 YceD family protein [Bacilli bacterium]NLJ32733.1 DUF177 domain-containing protein [Erysipelotrichaceae bacterium]